MAMSSAADSDNITDWRLDEIKGGLTICQHSLHGIPLILFGRVSPEATLPHESLFVLTAHESCSRMHARIAFDRSGLPWLRDLGSNNGTFVNTKKLPPQSTGRNENGKGEGSRGVRLFPGDMIQFGASSRCYILEGPIQYERSNVKPPAVKNKNFAQESETVKSKIVNEAKLENGVSWGIDLDEFDLHKHNENLQEDQVDFSLLDSSTVPEKHRKLYDKLVGKKYKLANITAEIQRIQRKESFATLSDGQAAQIVKNQNKERELQQEIEELEFELISKLKGDDTNISHDVSSSHRKRRRELEEDENDDDAFYDRTLKVDADRKHHSIEVIEMSGIYSNEPEVVETEQSLKEKWIRLFSAYEKRRRDTERLLGLVKDVEQEIQQKSLTAHGTNDEDLFFLYNDLTITQDRWKISCEHENSIHKELSSIEVLLHVIDKDYICDKSTGFVRRKGDLWGNKNNEN